MHCTIRLTAATWVATAYKKSLGSETSSSAATLIIPNKEMVDIMETAKAVKNSGFLIKDTTQLIKNGIKEQKDGFISMLLDTLGASLIGNI